MVAPCCFNIPNTAIWPPPAAACNAVLLTGLLLSISLGRLAGPPPLASDLKAESTLDKNNLQDLKRTARPIQPAVEALYREADDLPEDLRL